jgi:thioesterase domain-containing protein/acyl carrier protein
MDEASGEEKRLVAYLQGSEAHSATDSHLRTHLQQILPNNMLPSFFVWLDELPLTAAGKINRQALPTPAPERSAVVTDFTAPRDALELQLVKIWEEVLQRQPISITDNFFHIGGHSLLAVQLMARIEKTLGRTLPLSTLFSHGTVEQLATALRQAPDSGQRSPLIPIQPKGTQAPFFAVHPAGGTVLCYLDLARHLDRDQPFYALEAPGLSSDQVPYRDIRQMAEAYVMAVRAVQPQGPYFLGGWCFGGTIAFEMACQLQQQDQEIALLALIDTYAPIISETSNNTEDTAFDDATLYSLFVKGLSGHFGKKLTLAVEELAGLDRLVIVDKVLRLLQAEGIMPADAGAAQLQRYLDVYISNSEALAEYKPALYAAPVTLFRAKDEPLHKYFDETLGWAHHVANPIQIYDVSGDHGSMIFEPHVAGLAAKLVYCLEASRQRHVMNENS